MFSSSDTYDKAGNLIQSADQRSGVLHYVYDKIGRIQEARNSQTGRSETFAFDPAYNILDIPTSTPSPVGEGRREGKTTAPISDDTKTQGRLKSPANPNLVSGNHLKEYNGIEYTYDALGNLIYRQLPNGENQYYQYDLENQLVRAEIKKPAGNTEIWTYAYDPFGRRLSKERQDKLAWTSTEPKRTHFVWDGSRLLQEYTYKGCYTYIYTDQDSYEPLAQVFDNAKDGKQYLAYFHTDQIGIPREMTDIHGNLLWYGEYTAWGRLKKNERVYKDAHQPFRLQNQYFDEETGLHYNLMRYYEPEVGRFVNQDPIGLLGGANSYTFSNNALVWIDPLGLAGEAVLSPPKNVTLSTSKVKPIGRAGLLDIVLSLSGDTPNKEPFYYATYTRTHPVTGQVYCGRTHGFGDPNYLVHRRGLQQKHLNAEGFSPPVLDKYSTSSQAIRGREQQLIDFHGGAQSVGGTARNKINGVSAWNPNGPYYNWASTAEFGALPDNSPARMRLW